MVNVKKILSIVLVVLLMLTMLACGKKKQNEVIVKDEGKDIDYDATVYMIDSWKEGESDYYVTLLMYSKDYYDAPTEDDIKYKTDGDYKTLTEVIDNVAITVYSLNQETRNGICTYAKIKSSSLIDTKKIYVLMEGPAKYEEGIVTKEEYLSKNGSLDGWKTLMTNISSKIPIYEDIVKLQTPDSNGVIRLSNNSRSEYYYSPLDDVDLNRDNMLLTGIYVDALCSDELDTLLNHLIMDGKAANVQDGKIEYVDLDDRLEIYGMVIDGYVWIGFKTVDNSNFVEYDGEIPNAIVHTYDKTSYFIIGD